MAHIFKKERTKKIQALIPKILFPTINDPKDQSPHMGVELKT